MLKPGDTVDHYRVDSVLGQGGMATVYKVEHTVLGSWHALKVLNPDLVAIPELRTRFLAEGRIQAQLRHPNIAAVTDVVSAPGVAGLIVEYVHGPNLERWLADRIEAGQAAPSLDEILAIFLPVLDGVGYAHAGGVVHRDLKPANITLCTDVRGVRPVILDFGIARLAEHTGLAPEGMAATRTGMRLGTLDYMSPEQVRGEGVDSRADIFALGAILYELATLRAAFQGDSAYETMKRITLGPDRALEGLSLPPTVDGALRRALAPARDARFPDCASFAAALRQPTPAPPAATPQAAPPKASAPQALQAQNWTPPARAVETAESRALTAFILSLTFCVSCFGAGHIISLALALGSLTTWRQHGVTGRREGLAHAAVFLSLIGIFAAFAAIWVILSR